MQLKINGKEQVIEKAGNLAELVESRGLDRGNIVVEHNHEIIPKDNWAGIRLKENDNVEIISFVGGG
ncbi:MAG: sulfur carrier protein ThiS [Candidatus Omnitrophota bacterium]